MRLGRVFSQAGQGLRRNLTMSIAGVLTVMIALWLLAVGLVVHSAAGQIKNGLVNQLNISVYLTPNITQPQQAAIEAKLNSLSEVEKPVQYVSQTQAYALFKQYYAGEPEVIKLTPKKDVSPSFVVKLYNPQQFEVVNSAVGGDQGVFRVEDAVSTFQRIFTVLHGFSVLALGVSIALLVVAAFLIYIMMQVSAFNRRRETGIMRLVGASDLSIQLPFVMEGTLIGLVGGGLAFGLLLIVRLWVKGQVAVGIFAPFGSMHNWIHTLPIILVLGVGLSALLSVVTLQRHLRV